MKYWTNVLSRYQGGFGFIAGAAAANLQGFVNRGIFAAGIAYNEKNYLKTDGSKDYNLSLYTAAEFTFSDIELQYEFETGSKSLKFGFGSMIGETDGIFAPPPMVSFKRSKNLGITVIDEGDESEIVENFGINSWDIDIRGLLIDMDEHVYPQSKVKEIARWFEINDIIKVVSPIFQDLGINSIYFKDQQIDPVEAYPDTIKFTLNAKSIKPAEFSIINGK